MPTVTFTVRSIFKACPVPPQGRIEYFDESLPDFGQRVSSTGHRSWFVIYRNSQGTQKRFTIGPFPKVELAAARKKAKEVLRHAADGQDPQGEKVAKRLGDTVEELAAAYIERYAKGPGGTERPRKKSWRTDEQIIQRYLLPAIGKHQGADVKRADIRATIDDIAKRGGRMANKSLSIFRKFFGWCIEQELGGLTINPCDGIPRPAKDGRRERVLSDTEIKAVWDTLPQLRQITQGIYRIMFLTGARLGEVLGFQRAEIVDGDWWVLSGERTKAGREHRIPLTDHARAVIAEMESHNHGGPWIFPREYLDRSGKEGPQKRIYHEHNRLVKATGIDFNLHDIRRTVASNLGAMRINRVVIGKILGHADTSVTSIYDRHSYNDEKRAALTAWARRLDGIVAGQEIPSNVYEYPARVAQ